MQEFDGKWGLGGVVMVGGAAAFYCYHKSLHDRHFLQSILTGVFIEKLPKAWKKKKTHSEKAEQFQNIKHTLNPNSQSPINCTIFTYMYTHADPARH